MIIIILWSACFHSGSDWSAWSWWSIWTLGTCAMAALNYWVFFASSLMCLDGGRKVVWRCFKRPSLRIDSFTQLLICLWGLLFRRKESGHVTLDSFHFCMEGGNTLLHGLTEVNQSDLLFKCVTYTGPCWKDRSQGTSWWLWWSGRWMAFV